MGADGRQKAPLRARAQCSAGPPDDLRVPALSAPRIVSGAPLGPRGPAKTYLAAPSLSNTPTRGASLRYRLILVTVASRGLRTITGGVHKRSGPAPRAAIGPGLSAATKPLRRFWVGRHGDVPFERDFCSGHLLRPATRTSWIWNPGQSIIASFDTAKRSSQASEVNELKGSCGHPFGRASM